MNKTIKPFSAAMALLSSLPAMADDTGAICIWKKVDGVRKCIPIETGNLTVIEPTWLVAGGVALAVLAVATIYLAVKISQLAAKIERQGRGR